MSDSSSATLISFLGTGRYNETDYHYPEMKEPVRCSYGATAFLIYIREFEKVWADRLMICGTVSSSWNLLPKYLHETADRIFAASQNLDYIRDNLKKLSEEFSFLFSSQSTGKTAEQVQSEFECYLKSLEERLNSITQKGGLTVNLLPHAEEFSSYDSQIELLNRIKNTGAVNSDSSIYLDITYGLRIMPFMVFASFQSLCYTENLKIRKICYSPEEMPKTEPLERLDFIEKVKNRLRYLKYEYPEVYERKRKAIMDILEKRPPLGGIRTSNICFLDSIAGILQDAAIVSRFRVSADPMVFLPKISSRCSAADVKDLEKLSYCLNTCNYVESAELINRKYDLFIKEAKRKEMQELLKDFFKWAGKFKKNVNFDKAEALKYLSSKYLQFKDYIHAINSCYSAVDEYEFAGYSYSDKTVKRTDIRRIYPDFNNLLVGKWRDILIHLNDKSFLLNDESSKVRSFFIDPENGRISHEHFENSLASCLQSINVPVNKKTKSDKHVMFTFIGSGDYGHASYAYKDPFHKEKCEFDVSNSRTLGISLAARLRNLESEKPITKLVVCGTVTSNWRVVLEALEDEFFGKMTECARETADEFTVIKNKIICNMDSCNNEKGSLGELERAEINTFFRKAKKNLSIEIVFEATDDVISENKVQQNIADIIINNVEKGDLVSFDITHSYRIIPVIAIGALMYLYACKNIEISHIFYGDVEMEKHFNFLNGLKRYQMPSNELFAEARGKIEAVLSDMPDEKELSGMVYDMKNLLKLVQYSSAINQYLATMNPMFLQPVMKIELRHKDPESYECFKNGVVLNNLSMFRACADNLLPVVDKLRKNIDDPVLKTLKESLLKNFDWLDHIGRNGEDKYSYRNIVLSMARNAFIRGDFIFAYMCCYEAVQYMAEFEYRILNELLYLKKIYTCDGLILTSDELVQSQKETIEKINNIFRWNIEKKYDLTADEFFSENKSKELKMALICKAFIGREYWEQVKTNRNLCFHERCPKQSLEPDAIKKLFMENIIPEIERIVL